MQDFSDASLNRRAVGHVRYNLIRFLKDVRYLPRLSTLDINFHLSTASRMSDTIRIAVIGAGSAGIAQAKQAIDAFHSKQYLSKPASDRKQLELVVFEERDEVGGVWSVRTCECTLIF